MFKKFIVNKDYHNSRFDRWFKQNISNVPQSLIEKLVRKRKVKINKKKLFSKLQNQFSVKKVFNELSKRYSTRKGGYSRVLKAGFRTGDDAPMAVIELVDRDLNAIKVDKPKKTETAKKDKEILSKAATK